ncbi:MAG: helix-turn-helix transcriptional regulator [Oscillospiraceae bacterium]|nr:helix-turn-helix transcriptional regulator [Oscillospiraceae bacterium]
MQTLYKYSDTHNKAFECICFSTEALPFPIELHWHYFGEMLLLLKGRLLLQIDTKWYNMEKGDFIFIFPETVHGIFSADGQPAEFLIIKFDYEKLPELSERVTISNPAVHTEISKLEIHFDADLVNGYGIDVLFRECFDESTEKGFGYEAIIRGNVQKILIILMRIWKKTGEFIVDSLKNVTTEYELYGITEYIDKHSNESITVTDIAKLCGMSYSNFAKKFRELYGISCKEYIDKIKIMKIENLLACTNYDLNYISQETGYADCSHMIRVFKKVHNMTPKEFRNEARKNQQDKVKANNSY